MDKDKQRLQEIETIKDKLMVILMEMREEKETFEEALNLFFCFSAACLISAGAALAAADADEQMVEDHAKMLMGGFHMANKNKASKIIIN